jgi:hypothetical protein
MVHLALLLVFIGDSDVKSMIFFYLVINSECCFIYSGGDYWRRQYLLTRFLH